MTARFDAVIFDMDGVLVDSEPLHYAALERLLADEGAPPLTKDLYRVYLGASEEAALSDLAARFALARPLDEYRARYDAVMRDAYRSVTAAPGAAALLGDLRARGFPLGLASSSRGAWVEAALAALALPIAFDAIVTGDDVRHAKPDPEIYLTCAAGLGVAAGRCVAVEDAPLGVRAAARSGMTVIAVRTRYVPDADLAEAAHVVDDLAAVADLLAGARPSAGVKSRSRSAG